METGGKEVRGLQRSPGLLTEMRKERSFFFCFLEVEWSVACCDIMSGPFEVQGRAWRSDVRACLRAVAGVRFSFFVGSKGKGKTWKHQASALRIHLDLLSEAKTRQRELGVYQNRGLSLYKFAVTSFTFRNTVFTLLIVPLIIVELFIPLKLSGPVCLFHFFNV